MHAVMLIYLNHSLLSSHRVKIAKHSKQKTEAERSVIVSILRWRITNGEVESEWQSFAILPVFICDRDGIESTIEARVHACTVHPQSLDDEQIWDYY